jgi:enolase
MATDQEVYRYYEILAHLQYKNYTDNLPIVSYFNGVGQTQPQISFQSFMIWDTNGKDLTRRQVKNELPELEKKYKEIKDNYYSSDQIEKRKKVEE